MRFQVGLVSTDMHEYNAFKLEHAMAFNPVNPIDRVVVLGLMVTAFFGFAQTSQAQLNRCTYLQQQQFSSRCERPGMSSASSMETIAGHPGARSSTDAATGITGLPDLTTLRPYYGPSNSTVEPARLPIDSFRDYLNRKDPEHAIQPIQLPPQTVPLPGGNR